jgi:hypothetical protein
MAASKSRSAKTSVVSFSSPYLEKTKAIARRLAAPRLSPDASTREHLHITPMPACCSCDYACR